MSNKKNNEKKTLDELQKNSKIDELKENESGELQGGFMNIAQDAELSEFLTINFSKCGAK